MSPAKITPTDKENAEEPAQAGYRIALAVEYDGSAFSGWQRQASPELPTVQGVLEHALAKVADADITVICAGRTDSGVHATCQVVHFDCAIDRGSKAWTRGVNTFLPPSVRVLWAEQVDKKFHARFSATARRYNYVIYQRHIESAILAGKVTHLRNSLDAGAMHEAAQYLIGEQDFSSFRAAGCQSNSPNRNIISASVERLGNLIVFDVQANAFLQHMVRNIVGSLLEVGRGQREPVWIKELIEARDRTLAGVTAAPDGLYLVAVEYPEQAGLPETMFRPVILGPCQ